MTLSILPARRASFFAAATALIAFAVAFAAFVFAPVAGATVPSTKCLANPLGAATGYT